MARAAEQSASECNPDRVANSIQTRLDRLPPLSDRRCIFTIPKTLRQTNKEAYTPHFIAIGPYHHFNESLLPMEDHKLLYLKMFLQLNEKYSLKYYTQEVKSWEDEVRKCYDGQIHLNSNQFTEMILLDSTFVIQLLLMHEESKKRNFSSNDRIFSKPWLLTDVCRDMALLENQIPFFVLLRLFSKATGKQPRKLLELICLFFEPATEMKKLPESVMGSLEPQMELQVKHLVDVIRLSFLKLEIMPRNDSSLKEKNFALSATDLVAAGVKLRRVLLSESKCLLDIEFKNGVLKIPQLVICDLTEHYFRNIIAFEQCHYNCNRYLTDYMDFMDRLVDTSGDAKLLIDKGIIQHQLSNEEAVANLINAFGKEVSGSGRRHYFNSLSHQLVKHCEKPHNKWKATFKRDYCGSPWKVISVVAAVVLLLLTVVQAVCSVLSLK